MKHETHTHKKKHKISRRIKGFAHHKLHKNVYKRIKKVKNIFNNPYVYFVGYEKNINFIKTIKSSRKRKYHDIKHTKNNKNNKIITNQNKPLLKKQKFNDKYDNQVQHKKECIWIVIDSSYSMDSNLYVKS